MARFLLPAFRGEGGEPTPRGGRGWETRPIQELESFSRALAAPKDLQPTVFVDAIPDIWGKALLFAWSLKDESHPLHERSVAAFRGFLIMLAMRHVRKYNVTVATVDIHSRREFRFASSLARLLPGSADAQPAGRIGETRALSPHAGWDPAYVFLLDDEVIGLCSPLTLIAPREGADMPRAGARRLTDGFRFRDLSEDLSAKDAAMVRDWLDRLQKHLMQNAEDNSWRVAVTSRILDFRKALDGKASSIPPRPVSHAQGDLGIETELFRPLGQALELPASIELVSNFELQTRAGAPDRLLIMDEEMVRHLPGDAEIINGVSAAVLKGQPLGDNPRTIDRHSMPAGWRWLRPDAFFLPRMSVIQMHGAFRSVERIPVHQGRENDDDPLPPLREEIARYLDADYVSRNCWFERGVDGFTFKLKLPIAGGGELEARRVYKFAELNKIEAFDMPVTEIWPSTKLPGWRCWYTFWARDEERNRLYLRPCGVETVESKNTLDRHAREEVTLTREAPGYLACHELKDRQNGLQTEPLGLVIPSFLPAQRNAMPRTFSIGFDFGTTNTHIFLTNDGGDPAALSLSPETVRIFNNEEKKREGLMYRLFVPSQNDDAPFLSLLRRRVELAGGFEALRDAHVLFYHQQVEGPQFDDHAVEAYLKWRPELNDDRNAFLRQLVLHSAYEARQKGANRLKFIYSYPTAFDERTSEILSAFWMSDVPAMSSLMGIDCDPPARQTESIATACYFNHITPGRNALLATGATVLDIGGGTTDISAWRGKQLAIQTSVRLSGREILLLPLEQKKDQVLEMLKGCMDGGDAIFSPLSSLDGERFYRRADAILRAHGDTLLERLKSLMGVDKFDRFRSEIAIRLTALVYYAGLLLRRTRWVESGSRLPDIYIGGNGCRVLHWVAPPKFQENHPAASLLATAYARGAGAERPPERLKLILSPHPKSEVACGLVYSVREPLAQPDDAIQTIAGESFEAGGKAHPETEILTPAILRAGLRVKSAREIENALNVYNEFAERPGAILSPVINIPQIIDRAVDEINNWAEGQTQLDVKGISVAPMFVTGVVNALPLVEWRPAATHAVSG